jgi:hypothetical protein
MNELQKWGLVGDALAVATGLKEQFPSAQIISGRRSLGGQAHAMAKNTLLNPNYIVMTYQWSHVRDACVNYVRDITRPFELEAMASGLLAVLEGFTDEEIAMLSVHPSGLAFDVMPIHEPWGLAVKAYLLEEAIKRGGRFLYSEAGLEIWHWQAKTHV